MGMHRMSGLAAAALIQCFVEGKTELTEDEFDDLVSVVVGLLEDARDEKWRLSGGTRDTEPPGEPR